jgi:hypothetical protein
MTVDIKNSCCLISVKGEKFFEKLIFYFRLKLLFLGTKLKRGILKINIIYIFKIIIFFKNLLKVEEIKKHL